MRYGLHRMTDGMRKSLSITLGSPRAGVGQWHLKTHDLNKQLLKLINIHTLISWYVLQSDNSHDVLISSVMYQQASFERVPEEPCASSPKRIQIYHACPIFQSTIILYSTLAVSSPPPFPAPGRLGESGYETISFPYQVLRARHARI